MKTIFIYFVSLFILASGGNIFAQETNGNEAADKLYGKATIAGKEGGAITRKDLLDAKGLMVNLSESRVTEFKMTVVNAGDMEEFTGKGNKLTVEMRKAINNASPHAKVLIEYIKCIDMDGNTHLLTPMSIELK